MSSIYTFYHGPQELTYFCLKFGEDLEFKEKYSITVTARGSFICSCPAHISFCRHAQMLNTFADGKLVSSGMLYDYKTKKFTELQVPQVIHETYHPEEAPQ